MPTHTLLDLAASTKQDKGIKKLHKKPKKQYKSTAIVPPTPSSDEESGSRSQQTPVARSSQRQSIPTRRLCDEIQTTLLEAEKAKRNSDSQDSDEDEPLINRVRKPTKPKTTQAATVCGDEANINNNEQASEKQNTNAPEQTEQMAIPPSTNNAMDNEASTSDSQDFTFPQRISQDLQNAIVTNPSLHHLSYKAKQVLLEHLDNIEQTYQRVLLALPLENAQFKIAEVTTPFSDPKLDAILERLEALENKLENGHSTQAPQQLQQSYATAVKAPKSTIMVKPKVAEHRPTAVLEKLRTMQCPEEIRITKLKVRNNGLEVRCDSEEGKDRLSTYLTENLAEEVEVQEKRPALQRLIFFNIPPHITEQQLTRSLGPNEEHLQNTKLLSTFAARREGCKNAVLLCPKRLATQLINTGYVTVGFLRIRLKKHIRMHRCKKCQSVNHHHTSECQADTFCPLCTGNHTKEECSSKKLKCINCHTRNGDLKEDKTISDEEKVYLDIKHAADSHLCPTYQDILYERIYVKH